MKKTKEKKIRITQNQIGLIYLGLFLVISIIFFITLNYIALVLMGITIIAYFAHLNLIYANKINDLKGIRYIDGILQYAIKESNLMESIPVLLSIKKVSRSLDPFLLDWKKKWNKEYDKEHFFYHIELKDPILEINPIERFILVTNGLFNEEYSFPEREIFIGGFNIKVPLSKPREFTIVEWKEGEIPIIINSTPDSLFEGLTITKEDVDEMKEKLCNEIFNPKLPTITKLIDHYYFIVLTETKQFEIILNEEKGPELKSFDKFILRSTKLFKKEELENQTLSLQFSEMLSDSLLFKDFDYEILSGLNIPIMIEIDDIELEKEKLQIKKSEFFTKSWTDTDLEL